MSTSTNTGKETISPEERLRKSRERNRDHSRRSRERKKAFLEGLKKQVTRPPARASARALHLSRESSLVCSLPLPGVYRSVEAFMAWGSSWLGIFILRDSGRRRCSWRGVGSVCTALEGTYEDEESILGNNAALECWSTCSRPGNRSENRESSYNRKCRPTAAYRISSWRGMNRQGCLRGFSRLEPGV